MASQHMSSYTLYKISNILFFFPPLHLVVDFSKRGSDNRAIHILSQRSWVFILRIRVHS
ncbi:LOW QUALITY PROTEIN: hypothetical protein PanWU01x14_309750 [Parasponia andersonii]|uniref:Uncharacterized protein n=1 Tax=Parasponia andersonii TaxID=3476 RepID=A0A2P5AQG5_PARAD|nr:LOW QUALITY PROTEIN: hypothetical protein PanWU01x14_309750 [Parasponia andersonii]